MQLNKQSIYGFETPCRSYDVTVIPRFALPPVYEFILHIHVLRVSWWRHQMETFSALLAICAENSPVPVNSPHKGQWRGALMFSLICVWINSWVNDSEAGDLRRYRAHYDVTVMYRATFMMISAVRHIDPSRTNDIISAPIEQWAGMGPNTHIGNRFPWARPDRLAELCNGMAFSSIRFIRNLSYTVQEFWPCSNTAALKGKNEFDCQYWYRYNVFCLTTHIFGNEVSLKLFRWWLVTEVDSMSLSR